MVDYRFEIECWEKGITYVAGIDEAGRGPLAGPVVAAAVILSPHSNLNGVDDSKKLSSQVREELFETIARRAMGYGIGIVSHEVIDEINIYRATLRAMSEAVGRLSPMPQHLLVDGPRYQQSSIPFTTVIDGDAKCYSIAAASIIAKVTRDKLMREYDALYPEYGFAQHKGYGTVQHREALKKFGPCPIHRKSFRMPSRSVAGL